VLNTVFKDTEDLTQMQKRKDST